MPRNPLFVTLALAACASSSHANPFANQPKADEVFYHFMPIAWRDGDQDPNRFGDFQGMIDSLPYLQGLGVTSLWMNPIFPSPAYHGYQHGRADEVNPWFGTEQQFLDFVAQAKLAGIETYLDFVVYGISHDSPWHQSAFANPGSQFDDWLAFENASNTQYTGYTFPTWNNDTVGFIHWDLRNPDASDLVIEWSKKWLDPNNDGDPADGIAGYRLDHVWVDYQTGPNGWGYNVDDFWTDWHDALRALNPDVFTFAEQADWGSRGAELLPAFDAAMTKPFEFAARDALRDQNASRLYDEMRRTIDSLPDGQGTYVAIINDHDIDRLASAIGADSPQTLDRQKAAAAVLLLQPFPPIVYYGDEVGMTGTKQSYGSDANDIPMREPMKWNAQNDTDPMSRYHQLHGPATTNRFSQSNDGRSVEEQQGVAGSVLETHRELIAHRHANVALRRGDYHPITTNRNNVWAFLRSYEEGEAPIADTSQAIAVAINLSGQAIDVELNLESVVPSNAVLTPTDLATGNALPPISAQNRGAYTVQIPAHAYVLIEGEFERPAPPLLNLDGELDDAYTEIARTPERSLHAALEGDTLYLATEPAGVEGDRFILTSDAPFGAANAPWAKAGTVADYDAYVGNEADNNWSGWFDAAVSLGPVSGTWLEAAIDLSAQYPSVPETIHVAAVTYGNDNSDPLIPALQVPAGDGDLDVTADEFLALQLDTLRPIGCPADYDGDGDVDLGDFGVFGAAFGSSVGDPNYDENADFDNDGDVDLGDFGVFGAEFGRTGC